MLVNRKIVGSVGPMLGLPSVLAAFAKSYAEMMVFSQQYVCGPDQYIHPVYPNHSYHPIARNEMARAALGEWLLFLDTDHAVPPDLLFRMLNAMRKFDAEVVTALYLHKTGLMNPTLWKFDEDGSHAALGDWPRGEVLEVDCAGAGALLVKTGVFARIREELGEEPFSTQEYKQLIGEDFAFFRRLHRLGIKTICPTYIESPHLAVRPLRMWKDYDPAGVDGLGAEVVVKKRELA